jgi:cobalt-zinc-cadmium efflux system outer membrane protein
VSVARKLVVAGVVVRLLLVSAPARAQVSWPVPVEDPLLASLIDEALSKNPDVAAARQAAVAAGQRPAQARSYANPMFAVGYTNDGWSPSLGTMEMTTLGFMASQELPYPGKRGLRGDIATREAGQVEQQAERVGRSITAAVKRGYYGLLLSRNLLDLIRDQEDVWKQIEGVARARYGVGQGAQQDVLRVQVEVTRIEQLRAEQEAETEIRLAELNRLLARAASAPLETSARLALRPVQGSLDQLYEWATAVSPELKGVGLGIERASLAVTLAKKQFKPDFSVQAAYMNRGGLDPMWQAGVGISIPLYRKRLSAGLAEADAQLRSTQSAIESVRLQLRFRTQERLIQLKTTERVATLYGEGIVPQDRMSVEAALANYQTGKVPFIAVLEALTTLYNDRATHLRLLANHEQTLASLEEASLDPSSGMVSGAGGMAVGGSSLSMAGAGGGASSTSGSGGMGNQ